MAKQEVYMEIPAVRRIAKRFATIADILKAVAKALQILSNVLKATAFIGLVGGYAVAAFIDRIRPVIQRLARKCDELCSDLLKSVVAYQRGDAQGATRFY